MKTRVEVMTTFPRPTKPANEEFGSVVAQGSPTSGWDAYEVWRTRIKLLQEQPNRTTRNG
jgi:hypothetical protein